MLLKTQQKPKGIKRIFFFFNVRHPLLLYTIYIYIRVQLVLVLGCVILFSFGSRIFFSFLFLIIIRSAPFSYDSYFLMAVQFASCVQLQPNVFCVARGGGMCDICTILVLKKFESSRGVLSKNENTYRECAFKRIP